MTGFIDKLHERQAEITASISALVIERDEIDAALRVFARFGSDIPSSAPVEASADKTTAPAKHEARGSTEPMEPGGAHDGLPVRPATNSPTSDEGQSTGKPAGSEGPAAPSLLSRVRSFMEAHPDATARQCADALGVETVKVRNTARGVIVFAPTLSPLHRRAAEKASEGPSEPKSPPAATPSAAIAFEPPPGEMAERTAKRIEVAQLHDREPWLTPEEAAARLFIPVVNLRIFTDELEIEWSQPRPEIEPPVQAPTAEPRTLRDRVAAVHRMHPTWGAGMISKELGCAYGSAGTYLAEARRAEKEPARSVA